MDMWAPSRGIVSPLRYKIQGPESEFRIQNLEFRSQEALSFLDRFFSGLAFGYPNVCLRGCFAKG
jgi:hypothetical protein